MKKTRLGAVLGILSSAIACGARIAVTEPPSNDDAGDRASDTRVSDDAAAPPPEAAVDSAEPEPEPEPVDAGVVDASIESAPVARKAIDASDAARGVRPSSADSSIPMPAASWGPSVSAVIWRPAARRASALGCRW